MRSILWIVGLVVTSGCPHNVNQDVASGPDAKITGAKTLKIAQSSVKESGIVTYPGGDRVDWKAIELPSGKHGRLDVTLTYSTPRPGLKVSFDVYDKFRMRVDEQHVAYKTEKHTRTASLVDVSDKVFVRVYAPKRGDAGKYQLTASFVEAEAPIDLSKLALPAPPPLPEVDKPCTPDTWARGKKGCEDICPTTQPPHSHIAACEKTCDGRNDPEIKSCADTMPCDGRNDPRIKSCAAVMACPSPADSRIAACNKPLTPPPPVYGDIVYNSISGNDTILTITATTDQKIATGWKGTIVAKGSDTPLDKGDFVVERVEEHRNAPTTIRARVHLRPDGFRGNLRVRIQGPTPTRP